jgi:hypothetical protein
MAKAKAKAKATVKGRSTPRSLNVLFIGNSFTQRNDLPGLVARLAAADDRTLKHQLISAGGASLKRHWNAGAAAGAIKVGGFDYVVLQEQSTLPIKSPVRMHESVRLFDQIIKAAGARTALYLTWARRHAPETQRRITDAYASVGEELGATVIPVGVAWERFRKKHDEPELYDDDGSHPSLAGSYLAACVMFATLLGGSPVGNSADVAGLTPAERALLQRYGDH